MKMSILKYSLLVAVYFLLVINHPFNKEFYNNLGDFHFGNILEVIAVYLALFTILFLTFYLTFFRFFTKLVTLFLFLSSSLVSFTILNYNTNFNSVIIRSVFETNFIEASSFFSVSLLIYTFFISILPCGIVFFIKIEFPNFGMFLLKKVMAFFLAFVFIFVLFYMNQLFFNSLIDNAANYHLKTMIIPYNYLGAFKSFLNEQAESFQPLDAKATKKEKNHFTVEQGSLLSHSGKKTIFIFVLGESARANSFSLNGYARETNPKLKKQGVISFTEFYSCGTATAISLPCMFSSFGGQGFSYKRFNETDNLLDIAKQAKYKVTWYDNGMGSQYVADGVTEIPLGSYYKAEKDQILIDRLPTKAELLKENSDQLIVLHQRGSHGPDYAERYTDEYRVFTPDCSSSVLKSCSRESVINAYDNTILYTDNNIHEVIEYLKDLSSEYNTVMLYVSDHGESTGEYGLYMHGVPNKFAPDNQIHIPFIVWFSENFKKLLQLDMNCVNNLKNKNYTHDNIFHSVIDLLDVKTSSYNKSLDIFGECRGSK